MSEKRLITRHVQKHDVEANWLKATNFTPLVAEIIIYDIDAQHPHPRFKIGDGVTNVNLLPFAGVDEINTLLQAGEGDKAVQQVLDATSWAPDADQEEIAQSSAEQSNGNLIVGALGQFSFMEGGKSQAKGKRAHAEGTSTVAVGNYSHSEGNKTGALGTNSHAEGLKSVAQGSVSHAEGSGTKSFGEASHTEGANTVTQGYASHAEGDGAQAIGNSSHAEGYEAIAHGVAAHAEGRSSEAYGDFSHAEGMYSHANGEASHASGRGAYTNAPGAFAHGDEVVANVEFQTVFGRFNELDDEAAFIIGGGEDRENRSNLFTIKQDGKIYVNGEELSAASNIFFAEYGVTTRDEILAAYQAGKACMCKYEGYVYNLCGITGPYIFFTLLYSDIAYSINGPRVKYIEVYRDNWSATEVQLAILSHIEALNIEGGSGGNSVEQTAETTSWTTSNPHVQNWINNGIGTADDGHTIRSNGYVVEVGAYGKSSFATGGKSQTVGKKAHVEGSKNIAFENNSHAEGNETFAAGKHSHAEGNTTAALGNSSHAEGANTLAKADASHAEGVGTNAIGAVSHAEGQGSTASGEVAHAEGMGNSAKGYASHAEGAGNVASGRTSHAEGDTNKATGDASHAGGALSEANHAMAFAHGAGAKTGAAVQAVFGEWNAISSDAMFVVGGGTAENDRKNIFEVKKNGEAFLGNQKIATLADINNAGGEVESNVFVATYGTTTYAEIDAAIKAGKAILVKGVNCFSGGKNFYGLTLTLSHDHPADSSFPYYSFAGLGTPITPTNYAQSTYMISTMVDASGWKTPTSLNLSDASGNSYINYSDLTSKKITDSIKASQNIIVVDGNDYYTLSNLTSPPSLLGNTSTAPDYVFSCIHTNTDGSIVLKRIYVDSNSGADRAEDIELGASGSVSKDYVDTAIAEFKPIQYLDFSTVSWQDIIDAIYASKTVVVYKTVNSSYKDYYWLEQYTIGLDDNPPPEYVFSCVKTGDDQQVVLKRILVDMSNGAQELADIELGVNGLADMNLLNGEGENSIQQKLDRTSFTTANELIHVNTDINKNENGEIISGAFGAYSSIFGGSAQAKGKRSQAFGSNTVALGGYSHAEGNETFAAANNSHAEGLLTSAIGQNSHSEGYMTTAEGVHSHAEGQATLSSGESSHAEGYGAKATAFSSHAEGSETVASNINAHAEGFVSIASGKASHAENTSNTASGDNSHAGGNNSIASSDLSFVHGQSLRTSRDGQAIFGNFNTGDTDAVFIVGNGNSDDDRSNAFTVKVDGTAYAGGKKLIVEGDIVVPDTNVSTGMGNGSIQQDVRELEWETTESQSNITTDTNIIKNQHNRVITGAYGNYSAVLGGNSQATGECAVSEGNRTLALGNFSHSEGSLSISVGDNSHSEGLSSFAVGTSSHAEGGNTKAAAECAHSEGNNTVAEGYASHAEGQDTISNNVGSHSEGVGTVSSGYASHAEGEKTIASITGAHAEGAGSKATGNCSHAEGVSCEASDLGAHAEGSNSKATNTYAHAEGDTTKATAIASHAEGSHTEANGNCSHAGGDNSIAAHYCSFAQGEYLITGRNDQAVVGRYNKIDVNALFIVGDGYNDASRTNAFEVKANGEAYLGDKKVATTDYVDTKIGDIESVLDSIIAIQNSLIGGNA